VGSLYVEASSRQLWYGVSPGQDASQSVLISDIVAIDQQLDDHLVESKAYTDSQVSTRALVSHSHVISDITGLSAALAAASAQLPAGTIILWNGALNAIPVGWVLCDGNNGTPNLRDRMIVGAGGAFAVNAVGGSAIGAAATTSSNGAHSHGGATQPYTLTLAETPVHNHGVNDPGHNHTVYDPTHAHLEYRPQYGSGNIFAGGSAGVYSPSEYQSWTDYRATGIYLGAAATGVSIQSAGGGGAHQHTLANDPGHTHTVSVTPAYLALAYIMKL
jgi:hypothetical protein